MHGRQRVWLRVCVRDCTFEDERQFGLCWLHVGTWLWTYCSAKRIYCSCHTTPTLLNSTAGVMWQYSDEVLGQLEVACIDLEYKHWDDACFFPHLYVLRASWQSRLVAKEASTSWSLDSSSIRRTYQFVDRQYTVIFVGSGPSSAVIRQEVG